MSNSLSATNVTSFCCRPCSLHDKVSVQIARPLRVLVQLSPSIPRPLLLWDVVGDVLALTSRAPLAEVVQLPLFSQNLCHFELLQRCDDKLLTPFLLRSSTSSEKCSTALHALYVRRNPNVDRNYCVSTPISRLAMTSRTPPRHTCRRTWPASLPQFEEYRSVDVQAANVNVDERRNSFCSSVRCQHQQRMGVYMQVETKAPGE